MTLRRVRWGALALTAALVACGDPQGAVCAEEPGRACVWAGTGDLGLNGDGLDRRETRLYWPVDLAFAPDGTPWLLDWNNHLIRTVQPDDTVVTVVGDFVGDGPPDLSDLEEPGAPGEEVRLNHPTDLLFLPDGRMLFAAWHNHKLRRVDPETGLVFVVSGRGPGFAGDGGPVGDALYNQPKAIAIDPDGAIFVLDQRNHRVRRIDPDGTIATVVGTGTPGDGGDGRDPADAELRFEAGGNPEPSGALAIDADGILYVSDGLNHRIRRVDLVAGTITTIAGTGEPGYSGDGGPATAARLNNARDLELGPDGRLWIADTENHVIRALDLETGVIETVVGTGAIGTAADGRAPLEVELRRPMGIAFDAAGDLYVADTFNSRIVKVAR
jgi:sugar lactone lactonase YvrE